MFNKFKSNESIKTSLSKNSKLDSKAAQTVQQSYENLISEFTMSRLSANAIFHRCKNITNIIKKHHLNNNDANDKNSIKNKNNLNECWKDILIEAGLIESDSFLGSLQKYADKLTKDLDIDRYAIKAKRILDSSRKDKSAKDTVENIVFYQVEPYIDRAYRCWAKKCELDEPHIKNTQQKNKTKTTENIISKYSNKKSA